MSRAMQQNPRPTEPNPDGDTTARTADTRARHSADDRLSRALAALQARADLEAAQRAAMLLTAEGLWELRAWLDARLGGGEDRPAPESASDGHAPTVPVWLSQRESEAVRLIALGYSNKQIASRLSVSVKTVETYKARAMKKLGLRGRVDLVRYAAHCGWLTNLPDGAGPPS
jgi:DNA-binding CsgD family transcriptional regulator